MFTFLAAKKTMPSLFQRENCRKQILAGKLSNKKIKIENIQPLNFYNY
jgi:hypothetical protein